MPLFFNGVALLAQGRQPFQVDIFSKRATASSERSATDMAKVDRATSDDYAFIPFIDHRTRETRSRAQESTARFRTSGRALLTANPAAAERHIISFSWLI